MKNGISTSTDNGGFECFIADTPETRRQVYALRYTCYRRRGAIDPRADRQFDDRFDPTPNHFSFLVRNSRREALATVRISVVRPDLGWTDSPARHVYSDHPSFETMQRESFVEASRLCFGPQARRDSFVRLLGNMAALAEFYQVEWLVACPRLEHSQTYQRLFGFRPIAAPRRYFGVKFETQLLGIRRNELESYVRGIRPMAEAWSAALARLVESSAAGKSPSAAPVTPVMPLTPATPYPVQSGAPSGFQSFV